MTQNYRLLDFLPSLLFILRHAVCSFSAVLDRFLFPFFLFSLPLNYPFSPFFLLPLQQAPRPGLSPQQHIDSITATIWSNHMSTTLILMVSLWIDIPTGVCCTSEAQRHPWFEILPLLSHRMLFLLLASSDCTRNSSTPRPKMPI